MRYIGIATILALVLLGPQRNGYAGGSATADVACGSSSAKSNIPNGAVFLSRADGPVQAVLDATNEYRTHSGISHGNGWYTHSTTYTPGTTGWPTYCSTPAEPGELQNGYPGASQINDGGLYRFYYQPDTTQPGSGAIGTTSGAHAVTAFWYQRTATNNQGLDTANWLWNTAYYAAVSSRQDGGASFYRVGFTGVTPYTQYSLYQYRDYQGINAGTVPWNYGNVCSTELAYAQQQAGKGTVNNTRYGEGTNNYPHARVVAGLNALYNSVENQCSTSTGFWTDFGAAITCFEGICDDAARQVTNCFADGINGHCYNDSNRWSQVRDNAWPGGPVDASGYSTARSISPDNVGGWSGWGYGTAAPYSVWSWDGSQQVYWNSAGAVYGCFF